LGLSSALRLFSTRTDPAGARSRVRIKPGPPIDTALRSSGGPRLGDRAREAIRLRHLSPRTEDAYVQWMQRYYEFHRRQHPAALGASHVTAFLNHLAVGRGVTASTQNQALAALVFLYREVLGRDLPWLAGIVRAKAPARLPVVLGRNEVQALLAALTGAP
jgi:site-specific recombinase XerD